MSIADEPGGDDEILAALEFDITEPPVLDLSSLTPHERASQHLVNQVIAGTVVDVSRLNDAELSAFRTWVRECLLESGQMHTPPKLRTPAGEALHSVWIACHVEWQKRRPS